VKRRTFFGRLLGGFAAALGARPATQYFAPYAGLTIPFAGPIPNGIIRGPVYVIELSKTRPFYDTVQLSACLARRLGFAAVNAPLGDTFLRNLMATHVLERTSPKGQDFLGQCVYCGTPNLTAFQANDECSAAPDNPEVRLKDALHFGAEDED
jgi:hypothetical protein